MAAKPSRALMRKMTAREEGKVFCEITFKTFPFRECCFRHFAAKRAKNIKSCCLSCPEIKERLGEINTFPFFRFLKDISPRWISLPDLIKRLKTTRKILEPCMEALSIEGLIEHGVVFTYGAEKSIYRLAQKEPLDE
jgi:hypothetical protein